MRDIETLHQLVIELIGIATTQADEIERLARVGQFIAKDEPTSLLLAITRHRIKQIEQDAHALIPRAQDERTVRKVQ